MLHLYGSMLESDVAAELVHKVLVITHVVCYKYQAEDNNENSPET